MASTAVPAGAAPDVVAAVDAAREGDREAFARVYDEYVDLVFGFVYRRVGGDRDLTEDLVADTFLKAWRALDTFTWEGVDFGAWLVRIARNLVYDHFKAAATRLERATDEAPDRLRTTQADDPEQVAVSRDLAKALGRALGRLKNEHRDVIELRFLHHLSVADTAAALDRSVGATKALQYRALRALAREVEDEPGLAEIAASGLGTILSLLPLLAVAVGVTRGRPDRWDRR